MNRAATFQALGFSAGDHFSEEEEPSTWQDLKGAIRSGIGTGASAFASLAPEDAPPPPPDYTEVYVWAGVAAASVLAFATVLHFARKV